MSAFYVTEHRQGAAWYEFRHDYLVGQVASWVSGVEQRLVRRRWITSLVLAAAVPALIWLAKATIDFNTYVVSFVPAPCLRRAARGTLDHAQCSICLTTGDHWFIKNGSA